MSKYRNWAATLNNYEPEHLQAWLSLPSKYIVVGEEVGELGTPHLQITVCFSTQITLTALKKKLEEAGCGLPHLEPCKDVDASIEYCKKEGNFHERGEWTTRKEKGQLEVNRWAAALSAAKKGKFEDIDPQIQISQARNLDYIHGRELAATHYDDTEVKHEWYYGASGTGKSRKARTENPDAYLKMCNKWWDGYNQEDVVLIEDFDKGHAVLCHHLKIWADRYPFTAEIKGAARKIRPKKIIITSNYAPEDIWTEAGDLEPILRRFKRVHFSEPFATQELDT